MWMRSTSERLPTGWLLVGQQYAWRGPEGGLEKRTKCHTNPCPGVGVWAQSHSGPVSFLTIDTPCGDSPP